MRIEHKFSERDQALLDRQQEMINQALLNVMRDLRSIRYPNPEDYANAYRRFAQERNFILEAFPVHHLVVPITTIYLEEGETWQDGR